MKLIFKFTEKKKDYKKTLCHWFFSFNAFFVPGDLFYQPIFDKNGSFYSNVFRACFMTIHLKSSWYELRPCIMNHVKDRHDVSSSLHMEHIGNMNKPDQETGCKVILLPVFVQLYKLFYKADHVWCSCVLMQESPFPKDFGEQFCAFQWYKYVSFLGASLSISDAAAKQGCIWPEQKEA